MSSTEKAREQALADLEARPEGITDVHLRQSGLGGVSRKDRVQEVLIDCQVSLMIEVLHHHSKIELRQCSERGA